MGNLAILIIGLLTFITRVINLDLVPIFTDEAIYIRWAQIGLADPAHRFISLTDGKQPLFTWLMYPLLMFFSDPLIAGRFVSVLSAIVTSIGLFFLGRKLFSQRAGIITALLYIILPFTLVYDRLALMDSLLSMFFVWGLYLAVHLIQKPRLDVSMLLGMTAGMGMLTKSNGLFIFILLPLTLIIFDWRGQNSLNSFFKWVLGATVAFIIAQIMYQSLRLSPWFYIIEQKNQVFILTLTEFFTNPLQFFLSNLTGMAEMLLGYLTLPVVAAAFTGVILGILQKNNKILLLALWFAVPFLVLAGFGKIIFPRFMLFMVMPLLSIAGFAAAEILKLSGDRIKWIFIILVLVFSYTAYISTVLIISPVDAAIPQVDRNQLFDDWPSGYGVKDVIGYLKEKASLGKIVVGTEGTFGLNPTVYEIYLEVNPNVEIHGYWPVSEVPGELLEAAKKYPTFLIFKEKQEIPSQWPLRLIESFQRGKGNSYLRFYQVTPPNSVPE